MSAMIIVLPSTRKDLGSAHVRLACRIVNLLLVYPLKIARKLG